MTEAQNETWIIIRSDGYYCPARFKAYRFIRQSKSRVYYDNGSRERITSEDKVAAFGLTEKAAKLAEAKLCSSRELYEQERKAAHARAHARSIEILSSAMTDSAQAGAEHVGGSQ